MVGIAEVLIAAGAVAALAGGASKKLIKDRKARSAALVGGIVVALVGLQMGGYFAFLTTAPGEPPKAAALYKAFLTSVSDTDRTETETLAPDQQSLVWVLGDVQMDGLGDINPTVDILNLNVGETTDLWYGKATLSFVGTVIVSGIPTPVANYTADRSRFAITWTDTDASGTWVQIFDYFESNDVVTGGGGTIDLDIDIDPAVADDVPAGGSFEIRLSVVGVTLTCSLRES